MPIHELRLVLAVDESGRWPGILNPGPHGPEPSRLHVLECPADSAGDLLNSIAVAFVSSRDLIGPSGAGNA
jgi:hypothetical protein